MVQRLGLVVGYRDCRQLQVQDAQLYQRLLRDSAGSQSQFNDFDCVGLSEWLGSRVLDSGAVRPGFKSQPRRCRVTVLGKLFTPIVLLFTNQRNW